MKSTLIIIASTIALVLTPGLASAKGCLKGAAVGGVVGHFAGHHAVLGATAGCLIGHHRAKKQEQAAAQAKNNPAPSNASATNAKTPIADPSSHAPGK